MKPHDFQSKFSGHLFRPTLLLGCFVSVVACEAPKPDRLALDPSGPFHFQKKAQSEAVQIAAFRGDAPYVKVVPAQYTSSDASVATVNVQGIISATGSGKTKITASAWGLSTTADVEVVIVGSVEVADDFPHPLKLSAAPKKLTVTVKDDKGNVIEKPNLRYRATDYCVEVGEDDGVVTPLTVGDCDVIVTSADKSARIKLQVK